jgi:hypothetical protein
MQIRTLLLQPALVLKPLIEEDSCRKNDKKMSEEARNSRY